MKFIDITGQRFGRLVAIERTEKKGSGRQSYWRCRCDCSNEAVVSIGHLRSGHTKSCGCLSREKLTERNKYRYYNKYDLSGEYGIGYTSKGKEFYFDLEDYDKIKEYTWFSNCGYIATHIDNNIIRMHRFVIDVIDDLQVDHINMNKNDNRKSNLRLATNAENSRNKKIYNNTGAKGVFKRYNGKYMSKITCDGIQYYLGTFNTVKQAADAYDKKAIELFGEFAHLNNYNEN